MTSDNLRKKPLIGIDGKPKKAYGHIPHMPGSRMGPGDHMCDEGQKRIATEKVRDRHDRVIVQEKTDGCLYYRAPIMTDKGQIEIGKIVNQKLPVLVASYNTVLQRVEFKKIIKYHKFENNQGWVRVVIKSKSRGRYDRAIICTPNHNIYSDNFTEEKAQNLKTGDGAFLWSDLLDYEVQQSIIGGLLGDSSIIYSRKCKDAKYGFIFRNGIDQTEYFDFKKHFYGNIVNETKGSIGGFKGSKRNRKAGSIFIPSMDMLIRANFYSKPKRIRKNILNFLDPLGIAIWYMDDGSCTFSESQRPRARLSTNGFSFKEVNLLSRMLKKRFGVENDVHDYKGPTIVMSAEGTEKFFCLINPYITKSMKYKIDPKYIDRPCILDSISFNSYNGIIKSEIQKVEPVTVPIFYSGNMMYDLTIEDNHNYFAGDILVHNSCCSVAKINGVIVPLTRSGYVANTSPFEMHHHFYNWVWKNNTRFEGLLQEGERVVGEWLGMAHGTLYNLHHEPFVVFDLMTGTDRKIYIEFECRVKKYDFISPNTISIGAPLSIDKAMAILKVSGHGAMDPVEGAIWRVERNELIDRNKSERKWMVDFLVKYVRPDKIDGIYIPEVSGKEPIWNWKP